MGMRAFLALAAAAAALGGCTTYDDYDDYGGGGYRYEGDAYGRHGGGPFRGPGARLLDPWLAETEEGWEIVRERVRGRRGWISERQAERLNAWFRRYADTDRDLCLTDPEIRIALVTAAGGGRYARR